MFSHSKIKKALFFLMAFIAIINVGSCARCFNPYVNLKKYFEPYQDDFAVIANKVYEAHEQNPLYSAFVTVKLAGVWALCNQPPETISELSMDERELQSLNHLCDGAFGLERDQYLQFIFVSSNCVAFTSLERGNDDVTAIFYSMNGATPKWSDFLNYEDEDEADDEDREIIHISGDLFMSVYHS